MARKLIAGEIVPVALFDVDGNPVDGVPLADASQVGLTAEDYSAGNTHTPGANAAAIVTLGAPGAGQRWVIGGLYWSYNTTPTGGQLSFTIGGATSFTEYVTAGGSGFIPFTPPIRVALNTAVVVTLAAAGAAVTGSLNVHAWVE